jgi:hypothetical protein
VRRRLSKWLFRPVEMIVALLVRPGDVTEELVWRL